MSSKSKSKLARGVVGSTVLVAAGLTASAPAAATNHSGATNGVGCFGGVNEADNLYHTFLFSDTTSAVRNANTWARNDVYNATTDLATYEVAEFSDFIDVIVRDQDYSTYCGRDWHGSGSGPRTIGLYVCDSTNSRLECEQATVRYDLSWFSGASVAKQRVTACHEIGHTTGLLHADPPGGPQAYPATTQSCMFRTVESGDQNLAAHDKDHVNNDLL